MALQTNQTPGPDQPNDRPASSGSMHQRAAGGGVESAPSARDTTVKTTQDYVNLFTNFGTPPDVTAYLEHIDKHLIGTEQWFPKDTIQRISLQQPTGAQAIIAQDPNGTKYAAVLVFESALNQIQSVDYAPVSDRLEEAGAWLRSRDSSINIVSGYVLTNDDLPRVNQMINALARDLIPFTNESAAQFNAKQMALQGYEFVVDHNINSVRDFCDQHSPHLCRSRIDIGFLVSMRTPRKNTQWGTYTDTLIPFLAVGGFAEILGPVPVQGQMNGRYLVNVRITEICTNAPMTGAIFLGMSLAAQEFIINQQWRRQFLNFSKGSNLPNLGSLIKDPARPDHLLHINDVAELDQFIANNILPNATLSVDVTLGRHRIPALFQLQNPGYTGKLYEEASRFFDYPISGNTTPTAVMTLEWIGTKGEPGGAISDSRYTTYLDVVAKQGGALLEHNDVVGLLGYSNDPKAKASVVAKFANNFKSLYSNTVVAIHPDFLNQISYGLKAANVKITDPSGSAGMVPLTNWMGTFNDFSKFQSPLTQQGRGYGGVPGQMFSIG